MKRINILQKPPVIFVCDEDNGKIVDKRIFIGIKGQRTQWVRCGSNVSIVSILKGWGFYQTAEALALKDFEREVMEEITGKIIFSSVGYQQNSRLSSFYLSSVREYEKTRKSVKSADEVTIKRFLITKFPFETNDEEVVERFRLKHNFKHRPSVSKK